MTTETTMRSLDEIMSREPVTEPVQSTNEPATEAVEQGQPRVPQGKFASAPVAGTEANGNADQAAQAAVEGGKPEKGTVPLPALQAAREKERSAKEEAEALRRELAELRGQVSVLTQPKPAQPEPEKPKPPMFWEDPEGWLKAHLSEALPQNQQDQEQRLHVSELLATEKHGEAVVKEAGEALLALAQAGDPAAAADYSRIMASRHPYGELVTWHQRRKAMADIGDDPAAYRERLRAEILAEMQAGTPAAPTPQQPAAQAPMPTNFATARNEGPRNAVTYTGPKPLSEIVKGSAQ